MKRHLTTIDLPHATLRVVGAILEVAGFTLGTVGGGWAQMEREGKISNEESTELAKKMGAVVFDFDIQDVDCEEDS